MSPYVLPYSGFLSRGINNRVRYYIAVLKSAVFNAPLLIVTWEIVKTAYHWWRMSLWDYFKQKGSLPDPKRSLARTIPSAIAVHFHQEFLSRDKSNYHTRCLWRHGHRLWPRKLNCLIVLISLCVGGFVRLSLIIDAYYLTGSNRPRDFKFVRVVRSQYLVSLHIFNVLLNVRDKNQLYGN